ncbi:MAG: hypothetical protein AAFV88_09535 [Planctomycetota bacterium]
MINMRQRLKKALATSETRQLVFARGQIDLTEVAWRPDGQQLALATKGEIRIWDFEFDRVVHWFPHKQIHISELNYVCDGRLLAASGWKHATHFYDPIAQEQTLRCDSFLAATSSGGLRVVLHADDRFEVLSLRPSNVMKRFDLGNPHRLPGCGIHTESGTLWVSMPHKFSVLDFIGNRYEFSEYRKGHLAVDPLGRDAFVSTGGSVYRLPCNVVEQDGSKEYRFGPKELILTRKSNAKPYPETLTISSDGEKIGINSDTSRCQIVLSRSKDWFQASHTHAASQPIRVDCHPTRPLVATSSHHARSIEVRNTETDQAVHRLAGQQRDAFFSPDGNRLVVSGLGEIRVYDTKTWNLISQTDKQLQFNRGFACSFDGRWLQVESLTPRGLMILDLETLQPALLIPGDPLDPNSMPGCFDPTGRFMACDRGQGTVGVWDLYKLKQYFRSLDLHWPLPGLGDQTPLRASTSEAEVSWEPIETTNVRITQFSTVHTFQCVKALFQIRYFRRLTILESFATSEYVPEKVQAMLEPLWN